MNLNGAKIGEEISILIPPYVPTQQDDQLLSRRLLAFVVANNLEHVLCLCLCLQYDLNVAAISIINYHAL